MPQKSTIANVGHPVPKYKLRLCSSHIFQIKSLKYDKLQSSNYNMSKCTQVTFCFLLAFFLMGREHGLVAPADNMLAAQDGSRLPLAALHLQQFE